MVIFKNTWLVSKVETEQMNLYYALGEERSITILEKFSEGRAITIEIAIWGRVSKFWFRVGFLSSVADISQFFTLLFYFSHELSKFR